MTYEDKASYGYSLPCISFGVNTLETSTLKGGDGSRDQEGVWGGYD